MLTYKAYVILNKNLGLFPVDLNKAPFNDDCVSTFTVFSLKITNITIHGVCPHHNWAHTVSTQLPYSQLIVLYIVCISTHVTASYIYCIRNQSC